MKKSLYLLATIALLTASGCKEKELQIPDLSSGDHRMLVEELTGVQCAQCPDGALELQTLAHAYGDDKMIVVSIHSSQQFSVPFSNSLYDFRTQEGDELAAYLGSPLAYPSASFDRQSVSGNALFLPAQWANKVASGFQQDYHLGLYMTNEYDPVTRNLKIQLNATPESTLDGDNRITIMITQDSIVDVQQVNLVKVNNYVHRHVLRDVVTRVDGDPIGALAGGEVYTYDYEVNLSADWVAKDCHVVAFIHRGGADDRAVLQAVEGHAVE